MDNDVKLFNDPLDALCYMTECTLATVEGLELKSRPPQGELNRQRSIARTGIENLNRQRYTKTQAASIRCSRVQARLLRL